MGSNINQNHYGVGDNIAGNKIVLNDRPIRRLDEEGKKIITGHIPPSSIVDIRYIVNDSEAFSLAREIKTFLEEKYKIESFAAAIYQPPLSGIEISPPDSKLNIPNYLIKVGSNI